MKRSTERVSKENHSVVGYLAAFAGVAMAIILGLMLMQHVAAQIAQAVR